MAKANKNILVVEDEQFVRELYLEQLAEAGYTAESAKDGAEGIKALKSFTPDLIMLDLVMPKMTGFEFLQTIRKDGEHKDTPVIVLSNLGQDADKQECANMNACVYMVKTQSSVDDILKAVKKNLK